MQQPTTPAFCGKWRDSKCNSKAGEPIRKDPAKLHIWISQKRVPRCLSRLKILLKQMSGSGLSNKSSGFSDARRLKSPYSRHINCEALSALGGELDLFRPPPSMNLADEWSPTPDSEATKSDKKLE